MGDSRYRMYFFDLDHTILDFERSENETLIEVFKSRGIALNSSQIENYRHINRKWWSMLEKGTASKERVVVERFEEFCNLMDIDFDASELNEEYLTGLSSRAYFLPGAEEFLHQFKSTGRRMAIITNGVYCVQLNKFRIANLQRFFEFSLSSEEAGYAKPDPRIFEIALKRAGIEKDEAIYIGDSLESDFSGAQKAGIDFIWINPEAEPGKGPLMIARDFVELKAVLGSLEA
ncbi:MAG TPA: YjjG family noncanonical pyrimidine nucleotidase [Mesotoga sp.]|nr:YjjG family noncanonical pyrimidine nucleotidase [Mesotoga sp.]MDD4479445.1 YjjG family noncanonical pyrimidine nucleotidase [Mesotoga sp.]MDD5745013.1 YjjG family noncanonical pyrimidine nucleotidase [Mesotoga sp.]HOY26527.1 YjjG family noncanonical pyrimidine nucleotidase [Mesotoga sp.]HPI17815.1 YjjG family noncanonical pyrimidine nucleotidase [Mesotoga sp.]